MANENTEQNPAPAPSNAGSASQNTVSSVEAGNATIHMAESLVINKFFLGYDGRQQSKGLGRKGGWGSIRLSEMEHDPRIRKIKEAYNANPAEKTQAEEGKDQLTQEAQTKLPETLDKVRDWYRSLNNAEKCFVQAVAVLSGAPKHEIQRATEELYNPIREAEESRLTAILQRTHLDNAADVIPKMEYVVVDDQLMAKTYTTTRKIDKMRLFWKDTNPDGLSAFSMLVLQVIEEQIPLGGQKGLVGQNLLVRLETLPSQIGGESTWRVPHALGVLWIESDETKLEDMANAWVRDQHSDDWWGWRIAALLEGAFEGEYSRLGQKVYQNGQSTVLNLLSEWSEETHTSVDNQLRVRLGCAVAMTYRRLGQKHLQIAMKGLDKLLNFPEPESHNVDSIPEDIFTATASAYLKLASYGYTREVLAYLATSVEHFSLRRRDRNLKGSYAATYLWQRLVTLTSVVNTFVLLIIYSLGTLQEDREIPYSRPRKLIEHPSIPDTQSKDILLAGILAAEEPRWRQQIIILLDTLFIEDAVDLAFLIMREWAQEVLKVRGSGALRLRSVYLQFVVDVIRQGEQWYNTLKNAGYRPRRDIVPSISILKQWQAENLDPPTPLGAFAEDVLRQIQT